MRFKAGILLALMLFTAVIDGPRTYADMTADDTFYGGNDILYYDSEFTGTTCQSNSAGGSVTNDKGNKATVYNYFVKKGLSSLAAAAVTGNFMQEATVAISPTATNSIGAYGIAQWLNERKAALLKIKDHDTLEVQLDYVWKELNSSHKGDLAVLKKPPTQDPSALAIRFGGGPKGFNGGYEGYGENEIGQRGEHAADVFKQYGNGGATTGVGDSCTNAGNGNFVYFSQTNKEWASDKYGSSTIGISGCGPTTLAMIVATLFDKSVTPETMAKLGDANGSFIPGVGTSHTILLNAAAKKYDFKYKDMTNASSTQLIDVIKNGGLVYMAGDTAAPFTKEGHIVVLRGVTDDGKYIIGDPYRGESDTYTVSSVEANRGSTFGITKG